MEKFLIGAATAAHQVEGNNVNSDFWWQEHQENSPFKEKSGDGVDHYNRYEEDIRLLMDAGLNAYRFSIEWARIEPRKGEFDECEVEHYRKMLAFCRNNGVEPIVTLHHFSSPKWLIDAGGWENEDTPGLFAAYCGYVAEKLGDLMGYVCTINEANMGIQLAKIARDYMARMNIQVGVGDFANMPQAYHTFLTPRTVVGDKIIARAHMAAVGAIKAAKPALKVGLTLSLHDFQPLNAEEWDEEFTHYLPCIENDDFVGVQCYTRKLVDENGKTLPPPDGAELTQMGYEVYPQAVGNVVRTVARDFKRDIIVTENGIATLDDVQRVAFIREAYAGVKACVADGIPVKGYMYWSLLDNFEWQLGYVMKFGLIAVDRTTQIRVPKESLRFLGNQ